MVFLSTMQPQRRGRRWHLIANLRSSGSASPEVLQTRYCTGGGCGKILYWIVTFAMLLLGGGLAWLQLGGHADGLIAFQIGLAAPMLLQKLAKAAPDRSGGMGISSQPSVFDFLKG